MAQQAVIYVRGRTLVNHDPLRRCYNGAYFDARWEWTGWEVLDRTTPEKAEARVAFWKDLNKIAVDGRGDSARREFRVELEDAA